jgi:group I intron endonuclease
MELYIYKLTCLTTNKCYIGQTQQYKTTRGKQYKYGLTGRWCDHVSSSKRSNIPIHEAIREHGPDNFTQEVLETTTDDLANEREAYWIRRLNTAVPNGYNVNVHSRCKHRDTTNPADLYLEEATEVELKEVNHGGVPTLVYVYVSTPTGKKRLTFGQSKTSTFETALQEATACLTRFRERGIPVKNNNRLAPFENKQLQRIRLVPFNKTMVAIYLTLDNKQTRICFGGKHVSYEDSIQKAREFVRELKADIYEDTLSKSQQQVATSMVGAKTTEDK